MQRQPTREHTAPTASPTAGPSKPYNEAAAIPPDDAYVSLDCEFVGIMSGAEHALAQVSVCDFNGSVLYSSYCQSDSPVVDYRSWVSGVRPADLVNAPSFALVQERVREVIRGKILVGHALHNDLAVLAIDHPQYMIRDTAFYKPLQRLVHSDRPSLRLLAKVVLNRDVQTGEHGATTDAQVTMDIFKVHRQAWELSLLAGFDPASSSLSASPPPNGFHSVSPTFSMSPTPFSSTATGHVPPSPFGPIPLQSLSAPFPSQFVSPPPGLATPFKAASAAEMAPLHSPPPPPTRPVDVRFRAAYSVLPPPNSQAGPSDPPHNLAALETLQRLQQQKQQQQQSRSPSSSGPAWGASHNRSQSVETSMSPPLAPSSSASTSGFTRPRMMSATSNGSLGSPRRRSPQDANNRRAFSHTASSPKKSSRTAISTTTTTTTVTSSYNKSYPDFLHRDPSPAATVTLSQAVSDAHSRSSDSSDPFFNPARMPSTHTGKARSPSTGAEAPVQHNVKERGSRGARRYRVPLRDADSAIVPAAA